MKTKAFLLLGILTGMVLTQVAAQEKDTKSVQGWFESTYWSPVYCGDEFVEDLSGGWLKVHYVVHYKDGKYQWETDQLKGEVTSQTGEVFTISELDKTYFTDHWYLTWRFNLRGDRGTHYIGSLTYSYWTGEITIGKALCK